MSKGKTVQLALSIGLLFGSGGAMAGEEYYGYSYLDLTLVTSKDVSVTGEALAKLLTGKTAVFGDGAKASYFADGRYEYRRRGVSRGTYSFTNDRVCVNFESGQERCDRYVKEGKRYFLINGQGRRFPAKIR